MKEGNIIEQDQFGEQVFAYLDAIRLPERTNWDYIDIGAKSNYIHPTAIVGSGVKMGKNNYIGANCYIVGNTVIGDNNHFEAFVSIGTFPEHREYFNKKEMGGVTICNNNVFREFVTVNSGCTSNTVIGSNCWLLRGSHVGHDSIISDDVTLSCNVLIGGHSYLMVGANMGLGSVCHQRSLIGAYAMVGMNSTVTKTTEVEPYCTYVGSPIKKLGLNKIKVSASNDLYMETLRAAYQKLKQLR